MLKEKIILDCDPGHDDAIAIMVAGLHEKLDLLGISVVAGNQTYENVTNNALRICDYCFACCTTLEFEYSGLCRLWTAYGSR